MSKHNDNNRHVTVIPIGTQGTDNTQLPAIHFPSKSKIKSVKLMNGATIAASDTDFVQVGLQLTGGAVIAEIDSRAAHENGLVKNTAKGLNIVEDDVAAGSNLEIDYQEGGTVTLTNAILIIEWYPL